MSGAMQPLFAFGGELIERVQRHELNARLRKNCLPINFGQDRSRAWAGSYVTIMKGGRNEIAVFGEEHVIQSPRVSADAGDGQIAPSGFFQPRLQLRKQSWDVPMQRGAG